MKSLQTIFLRVVISGLHGLALPAKYFSHVKYFKQILFKNRPGFVCSGLAILLSFSLVSCSFFISGERTGSLGDNVNNANFILDQVEGKVVTARVNGLPEEFQISYKACFRDFIHQDNTLQNSVFKIHLFEDPDIRGTPKNKHVSIEETQTQVLANNSTGHFTEDPINTNENLINTNEEENTKTEECYESSFFLFSSDSKKSCLKIRTDSSGCLNWTEVYPYYPVNQSVWFRYSRAFEGTGVNHGVITIPMAVNPWLALDPYGSAIQLQLVDLRYHPVVDQKWKLVRLQDTDIVQCLSCSSDQKTTDCEICQKKKMSLSSVISHFEKQAERPRLWIDALDSSISQEYIVINQNPESVNQDEMQKQEALKQFKVCHSHVKENCDPPGRFFKVSLRIPLHIKVRNYMNEEELLPLTRGNYSLKAYLFLKDSDGKHIVLHRDMGFISTPLHQGSKGTSLNPEFYLHIPYENYSLRAFLGLKVQAEGELKSFFLPFESVFAFPDRLSSVIAKNALILDRNTLSFYETQESNRTKYSLMDSYNLTGSWLKDNRRVEGFRQAGWDIELNRLRFSEISIRENQCPTPVDRTIRYVGEVCIIDPLTNKVVPNIDITIQRQDIFTKDNKGDIVDIETDVDIQNDIQHYTAGNRYEIQSNKLVPNAQYRTDTRGCLQWVDTLSHQWYNREKYFVRKMIFSKKEWGFEGYRMIAINPWHWGFVFFQDITQLSHTVIRTDASRAERPRIILHDFRNVLGELGYTIDRWLGINIFQNILLLFKARVDRSDNISVGLGSQRPGPQDLRRGYYLLRFILVKSHTEEAGGRGNMVVQNKIFQQEHYRNTSNDWNTHTGWNIGRTNANIGQMMNTNLEYITHFETYVQVRDGIVNAYINFLFNLDQFIFIGSNNRLIVQILPTDPTYYTYNTNSCEIDPSRSTFKPFTDHELISQPFMGTFVPGDQRNWNIFKPLDDTVNLNLDGSYIPFSDTFSQQIENFIEQGKESHKLFMQLQTKLTVNTISNLSSKAKEAISSMNFDFLKVYRDMDNFLRTSAEPSEPSESSELSSLSPFNQTKDILIESIDQVDSEISTLLKGLNSDAHSETSFFTKIQNLLQEALSLLNHFAPPSQKLQQQIETIQESLYQEVISYISPERAEQLQTENKHIANKWFKPEISFPENDQEWSEFNMNLFADDEGLKVLSMDDDNAINEFLEDLKDSAKIHNTYYKQYQRLTRNYDERDQNLDEEHNPEEVHNLEEDDWTTHRNRVQDFEREQQVLWKNFELLEGDDFYTIRQKINQMYLPDFSPTWLDKILKDGIHEGTLYTPEVMTFFHSLCGFWFDKFYEKYLQEEQLNTIYSNHLKHFDYYKATLAHLKNTPEQYIHLFQAMEQYSLTNDMEPNVPIHNSPFKRLQDTRESDDWWTNISAFAFLFANTEEPESETFNNKTLTQNIYDNLKHILQKTYQNYQKTAQNMPVTAGISYRDAYIFNQLQNYRHPFFKCIADPFNFFHVEEKIIVGDIGSDYSDLKYEYGLTKSYTIQKAFDYAYSAQWSMSRSFSTSLGTGLVVPGNIGSLTEPGRVLNPLNIVTPFLSFSGVKLSSEWSTGRSDTEANRRQQSLRFAETGLYLQINHSVISIGLKRYRHCLVVRAKNHAFEGYENIVWKEDLAENFIYQIPYIKSGLMICSQDIDTRDRNNPPFSIKEDYFYMYQLTPGDKGQFQNPLNFRNRPFVISVRGQTEMEKLSFLFHSFAEPNQIDGEEDYDPFNPMTNLYNRVPKVSEGTRKAIQKAKIWDKTGFYPGVYNRKHDSEHYLLHPPPTQKKSMLENFGTWLYNKNPLGGIRFDETTPITDRGGKTP